MFISCIQVHSLDKKKGKKSNMIGGSLYCLRWWQKCKQTVLLVKNFNLLLETQFCTLFTHSFVSLPACERDFVRTHTAKLPTNNDASGPYKTDFTILLILRLNRTGDKMLPWGTPISCWYVSDREGLVFNFNSRWPWKSRSWRSHSTPCFHVVS